LADAHFAVGMWIRNNWVRGERDTPLTNFFHSQGIYHPDDISSIILLSLHRTLNGKEIDLEKQIEGYKAYWKPIEECHQKQRKQAVSHYNRLTIGDSITIFMPVDDADGSPNAILYGCPAMDWEFNPKKDLIIKGIVAKKYFINDSSNVFLTVNIKFMSRLDTEILMTKVKVGDNKDFSLDGLRIE